MKSTIFLGSSDSFKMLISTAVPHIVINQKTPPTTPIKMWYFYQDMELAGKAYGFPTKSLQSTILRVSEWYNIPFSSAAMLTVSYLQDRDIYHKVSSSMFWSKMYIYYVLAKEKYPIYTGLRTKSHSVKLDDIKIDSLHNILQ